MTTTIPRLSDLTLDPKAIERWARDLPIPDAEEIARMADIPRRVDAGVAAASAAVRGAMEQLPSQRRRRRRRSIALAGVVVTVLAVIGLAATWWTRRTWVADDEEDAELTFDREALDRAADDGANIGIVGEGTSDPGLRSAMGSV